MSYSIRLTLRALAASLSRASLTKMYWVISSCKRFRTRRRTWNILSSTTWTQLKRILAHWWSSLLVSARRAPTSRPSSLIILAPLQRMPYSSSKVCRKRPRSRPLISLGIRVGSRTTKPASTSYSPSSQSRQAWPSSPWNFAAWLRARWTRLRLPSPTGLLQRSVSNQMKMAKKNGSEEKGTQPRRARPRH